MRGESTSALFEDADQIELFSQDGDERTAVGFVTVPMTAEQHLGSHAAED